MMIKTSELRGLALDWAVATILGYSNLRVNPHPWDNGLLMTPPRAEYGPVYLSDMSFSTDWAKCGPIIAREGLYLKARNDAKEWVSGALSVNRFDGVAGPLYSGPTPLIAAMRCYVASKLGDGIDIPEEVR